MGDKAMTLIHSALAGGVSGPLGDHDDRPGAGQDRGRGHGNDRDQRVVAATGPPRVTDGGKVGEQVRPFGWPERVGLGELGEGGWNRA